MVHLTVSIDLSQENIEELARVTLEHKFAHFIETTLDSVKIQDASSALLAMSADNSDNDHVSETCSMSVDSDSPANSDSPADSSSSEPESTPGKSISEDDPDWVRIMAENDAFWNKKPRARRTASTQKGTKSTPRLSKRISGPSTQIRHAYKCKKCGEPKKGHVCTVPDLY